MGLQVPARDLGSGSGALKGRQGARPRELGLGGHGSSGRGGGAVFPAARQARWPGKGLERSMVVRCFSPSTRFGGRRARGLNSTCGGGCPAEEQWRPVVAGSDSAG